ncbi:hypothetical protein M3697_16965 [Janibacter melonis]|uniref:hypothetical protein n=1 Tax=Janibacter melonis TaxID=262209 RepID=UPI002042FA5C|nr:hypothetical protein [Janibacter melonis]MCM3556778.1 hypothetical protein [Janibacter melonis]
MGYFELLPTPEDVSEQLSQAGLTAAHRKEALHAVAYFLGEHSDYYDNEWQRVGEKEDRGSHDTLKQLAQEFRDAADAIPDSPTSTS